MTNSDSNTYRSSQAPEDGLVIRLKDLLARATAGPWELQDGCSWRRIGTRGNNGNVLCPSTYSAIDNHPDLTAGRGEDLYANLHLIVEAINALPALLDAILILRSRCDGMKTTLEKIAERAVKMRQGTDDWFELVEFEAVARAALGEGKK